MNTHLDPNSAVLALDVGGALNTGMSAATILLWSILALIIFGSVIAVAVLTRSAGKVVSTIVLWGLVVFVGFAVQDLKGTATDTGNTISDIGGGGGDAPAPGQ